MVSTRSSKLAELPCNGLRLLLVALQFPLPVVL
jgi:hypothetical protein